jgi:glycosyltransferase involved in cell wall biosynthesis
LIIVNDGSSNIDEAEISLLKNSIKSLTWINQFPNKGKGAALRCGVDQSDSDFVIFTDIDFPYTFESTLDLCKALLSDTADVVVGEREDKYYDQTPWQRKFVSKLLKAFNKNILRIPVNDTQCGLKGFNKRGKTVFLKTTVNRYLFDLEFLILAGAKKYGLNTAPIPVTLRAGVTFSKLNPKIILHESTNIIKIVLVKWFGLG